jgi:hypothetical protein
MTLSERPGGRGIPLGRQFRSSSSAADGVLLHLARVGRIAGLFAAILPAAEVSRGPSRVAGAKIWG